MLKTIRLLPAGLLSRSALRICSKAHHPPTAVTAFASGIHSHYHPLSTMSKRSEKISQFRLDGITCAPVTPFKANGDLNLDIYDKYVQHLLENDVSNVFAVGTTGEGNNMTVEERKLVAEAWVKAGKGKLKGILIHVGTGNYRESRELARHAQEIGADAVACVGPSFYKPDTLEMYVEYMAEVAAGAPDLPFYLYDINFMTGINLNLDDFFRLGKERIPNLRGVKHTSPIFPSMNTLVMNHPDMQIILGSDEMYLQALSIGMLDTVSNSYLGIPLNKVKEAFERGDMKSAREHQACCVKLCNLRRKYGYTVPGWSKAVLAAIGMDMGQPRIGIRPIPQEKIVELKKDLTDIGYFEWGMPKK